MKKVIVVTAMLVLLMGCYCKRCYGQTLDLWDNDTVIDATEAAEFRRAFYDICNQDLETAADILFRVAAGSQIPTGTKTVTINTAQLNRWFNTNDNGSFVNRAYWQVGRLAIANRRPPRPIVIESCTLQASTKIPDATKRTRFLNRLDYLTSSEVE